MADSLGPSPNRRRLQIALRNARENAQLTQREAAEAMEWSLSKLIRIETGSVGMSVQDLRALLEHYGVDDDHHLSEVLLDAARGSKTHAWWHPYRNVIPPSYARYLDFESSASSIRTYHPVVLHGLLHTDAYAAALLATYPQDEEEFRQRKELRMRRWTEWFRRKVSPELHFIIDEASLHRRIGGAEVMYRQLRELQDRAAHPRITLRVLPFTAGEHFSVSRPFTLLSFAAEEDEDILWLEDFTGGLVSRDDRKLIDRHQAAFEDIGKRALSQADSLDLIDRLATQLTATGAAGT